MIEQWMNRLVDWWIDWMNGWLIDWLIDWENTYIFIYILLDITNNIYIHILFCSVIIYYHTKYVIKRWMHYWILNE